MKGESYEATHYLFSSSLMLLLPLRVEYFPQCRLLFLHTPLPHPPEYSMKIHIHKMQYLIPQHRLLSSVLQILAGMTYTL